MTPENSVQPTAAEKSGPSTAEKVSVIWFFTLVLVFILGFAFGSPSADRDPSVGFLLKAGFVLVSWALANGLLQLLFERLRPNDNTWNGRFGAILLGGLIGFLVGCWVVSPPGRPNPEEEWHAVPRESFKQLHRK